MSNEPSPVDDSVSPTRDRELIFGSDDDADVGHENEFVRIVKELLTNWVAIISIVVILAFIISGLFAPYVAPTAPGQSYEMMQPPLSVSEGDFDRDGEIQTQRHWLGTDSFGQDVLSRTIYGAQISLIVAFATLGFSFTVGMTIGILAGYYGKWVDHLLMRYVDFQWAFPELILAVAIIGFMGGTGLINVIIAIGLAFVDDFARIIRGEILTLREEEYILAAKAVGMSDRRIMVKEMLPNALAPVIVQATFLIPIAILAEAGLSFLGVGVGVTDPTWGLLVAQGREFLTQAWWISVMPGFAIMIVVLAFNLLGDRLRDIMDVSDSEVSEGGAA